MAITGQNSLINSLSVGQRSRYDYNKITGGVAYTAGRFYDFSTLNGSPVANTWTGTALNAQIPSETSGFGIYHGGNVSPALKSLLNMSAVTTAATGAPGRMMLVDMCLYYPGINMNSATAQTLVNGSALTRYTSGAGLRAYLVTQTTTGATAHNLAMSYTNQAGTAGRTLPFTVACTASSIAPHISHTGTAANNYGPFIPLASGDNGLRSVQTVTISAASGAGTAALVLCHPIFDIPLNLVNVMTERDLLNQMGSIPVIADGACLTWIYMSGAATAGSSNFSGSLEFVYN